MPTCIFSNSILTFCTYAFPLLLQSSYTFSGSSFGADGVGVGLGGAGVGLETGVDCTGVDTGVATGEGVWAGVEDWTGVKGGSLSRQFMPWICLSICMHLQENKHVIRFRQDLIRFVRYMHDSRNAPKRGQTSAKAAHYPPYDTDKSRLQYDIF